MWSFTSSGLSDGISTATITCTQLTLVGMLAPTSAAMNETKMIHQPLIKCVSTRRLDP